MSNLLEMLVVHFRAQKIIRYCSRVFFWMRTPVEIDSRAPKNLSVSIILGELEIGVESSWKCWIIFL
jgi:hypothetical protein